jgi:Methyltransferase domain
MSLRTKVCKYDDFFTEWYRKRAEALHQEPAGFDAYRPNRRLHRKLWEWNAISQVLDENGMLEPGRRGCGFAVGREPLVSLFAARGVEILATDLPAEVETTDTLPASAWASTDQHSKAAESLHYANLVDIADFQQRVRFESVDMRNLNLPWRESFDFIWSSCSIEHLGSLEAGMKFVKDATCLLNPGGIAAHTTEFNVSSNDDTVVEGPSVIYRRKDIEQLEYELRRIRCALGRCDFFAGDHPGDIEFDKDPFLGKQELPHIKLLLGGHVTTSLLLSIRKGAN